jgi:hypothetical protein
MNLFASPDLTVLPRDSTLAATLDITFRLPDNLGRNRYA